MDDETLTPAEAAAFLGVSLERLAELETQGRIQNVGTATKRRYRLSDLKRLILELANERLAEFKTNAEPAAKKKKTPGLRH